MTRRPFDKLPDADKTKILTIAAEQFAKDGFQGTSYNKLLARMGLGKGSAYYYFADKQDLFLTVVKACYRKFFDSFADSEPPASAEAFWQHVELMNRRGLDFMVEDPVAASVLMCFRNERERLDVLAGAELLDSLNQDYERLARLGQRLRAVRRDLPMSLLTATALALSAAFDQWFVAHGAGATKKQRAEHARRFTELSRRLWSAEPVPASESRPSTSRQRQSRARERA